MKRRVLFITLIFLFPLTVFADDKTCVDSKTITINNGDTVSCDSEKITTAQVSSTEYVALTNDVCTIKCTETFMVSFNPVVKVLAGMGFRYPLYISAERTCKATYNTSYYEDNMINFSDQYDTAIEEGKDATEYYRKMSNLYALKKECDNFAWSKAKETSDEEIIEYSKTKKYSLSDIPISLYLDNSANAHSTYEWELLDNEDSYSSVVTEEKEIRSSCDYGTDTDSNSPTYKKNVCLGATSAISSWTEKVKLFGKYTVKNKAYLEKYTGNVKYSETEITGDNVCKGVDKYYTDFETLTKKGTTAEGINGYDIKLVIGSYDGIKWTGLGNNNMHFNITCKYQVDNLIYPVNTSDENNTKYGTTAFQYRTVDIDNPFPERTANANWITNESIITSSSATSSMMYKWQITLDRSTINEIKNESSTSENNGYNYSSFNLDENDHSEWIKEKNYIKNNESE